MNFQTLCADLRTLEAQAAQIKASGDVITQARIDSARPGGTARGNPSIQHRLRIPGQKARYLNASEFAHASAAIERGRQLRAIERKMRNITKQLDRIAAKAAALGIPLKR